VVHFVEALPLEDGRSWVRFPDDVIGIIHWYNPSCQAGQNPPRVVAPTEEEEESFRPHYGPGVD